MGKRKAAEGNAAPAISHDGDSTSDDEEMDIVNVDFDWFDLDPEIDFHGLKTLLRQTLDVDHEAVNLSELTDLILSSSRIGSTVKCDGKESDPFAYITIVDLQAHRQKPVIAKLSEYLLGRAQGSSAAKHFTDILDPNTPARVGLVLTERLINMPAQIIPPLYDMLRNELQTKTAAREIQPFSHYLFLSKAYTEEVSSLDATADRPRKKTKAGTGSEIFLFHAEDEVLYRNALAETKFDYVVQTDKDASDARRTFQEFGIKPQGHLILLEAASLDKTVQDIAEYIGQA